MLGLPTPPTPTIRDFRSPNFGSAEIAVEFLVLHYTACSLERTLEIFSSPDPGVCAHFVVDLDGTIVDLGGFWKGPIRRGAHAGKSSYELDEKTWVGLNEFSIGIEIVNFNGNLLPYTDAQYASLDHLTRHVAARFSPLRDPRRVVGHEQIAGFRGKVDPGARFDWASYFADAYPGRTAPRRDSILDGGMLALFEREHGKVDPVRMKADDWSALNSRFEQFVAKNRK
jgi:N-acetylmuramoyl-L-alanine amidase